MIVWVLLLIAAVPVVWSASPVGLMTVSGPVHISGSELEAKAVSSWPIVAGDEILTEEHSRAVLVSPRAGRLEIRQDSRVTATEDTVVLHQGEVGAERFVVQAAGYTARPKADAKGRSWFVVSSRGGVPVFAAHQGDVWVNRRAQPAAGAGRHLRGSGYASHSCVSSTPAGWGRARSPAIPIAAGRERGHAWSSRRVRGR